MAARSASASRARFATGEAARIVGVPPRRLRRCVGAGLLTPTRDERGHLQFDFVDLVLLRCMRGLLEKRVPSRQIGRVLKSLRRQIGDRPLSRLSVYADGRRVVAWDGTSRWQPDSGQFLLNFDAGKVVRGAVAQLPAPAASTVPEIPQVTADDWYDLANELEDDSPVEAKAAYRHALALDPEHVPAAVNLGCMLHAEGDLGGAEDQYRAVLGHDSRNALAWYNLGVVLEDAKRPEEAVLCYERGVWADPSFADAHYNLALLYEAAGRARDALRHLSIYRRLGRPRR